MSNVITFEVEKANPSRKVTEHMLKRRALEWAKKRFGCHDITIVNWQSLSDTFQTRWADQCHSGGKFVGSCFFDGVPGMTTFILKEKDHN